MTKLSEKKGGGLIYNPPMMQFDGSSGYYSGTYTSSGNKITVLVRFSRASFTGSTNAIAIFFGSAAIPRAAIYAQPSDHADTDRQSRIQVVTSNSAGTNICRLLSPASTYLDGELHTLFYEFDGDAGTAVFRIDGVDADDTGNADRIAPTTGTLASGASSTALVGADSATPSNLFGGSLGFLGCRDVGGLTWSDYMDQYGNPKPTDFSGWLFGHFAGKMDENEGTAGAMTKNGTITLVDPGVVPHIGLPTKGTAENWHIKFGKTAWVDGVEKTGNAYTPAMMEFDGSTSYYSANYTSAGNKQTTLYRVTYSGGTGGGSKAVCKTQATQIRMDCRITDNDHATTAQRGLAFFTIVNSSGTAITRIFSETRVDDGDAHTILCSYDGDTGTAQLVVNGAVEDNMDGTLPRIAPATATLSTGAGSSIGVGADSTGGSKIAADIGFCGMADSYLTSWSSFMRSDGSPIYQDPSSWAGTGFGAQPLFWNPHGDMENNLGSAGAMTKNGTINVGNGGAT